MHKFSPACVHLTGCSDTDPNNLTFCIIRAFFCIKQKHCQCHISDIKAASLQSQKKNSQCVVPENIHTPTTEGIRNSEGKGGQRPRNFQRGGGLYDQVSFQRDSRGPLIQYGFECQSSCSKILSYLLSRTFT